MSETDASVSLETTTDDSLLSESAETSERHQGGDAVEAIAGDSAMEALDMATDWKEYFTEEEARHIEESVALINAQSRGGRFGTYSDAAAAALRETVRTFACKGLSIHLVSALFGKPWSLIEGRIASYNKHKQPEEQLSFADKHESEIFPEVERRVTDMLGEIQLVRREEHKKLLELWLRLQRLINGNQEIAKEVRERFKMPSTRSNKVSKEFAGRPMDELWPEDLKPASPDVLTPELEEDDAARDVPGAETATNFEEESLEDRVQALSVELADYQFDELDPMLRKVLQTLRTRIDSIIGSTAPAPAHVAPPEQIAPPLDPSKMLRIDMGGRAMFVPEEIVSRGGKVTVTELDFSGNGQ